MTALRAVYSLETPPSDQASKEVPESLRNLTEPNYHQLSAALPPTQAPTQLSQLVRGVVFDALNAGLNGVVAAVEAVGNTNVAKRALRILEAPFGAEKLREPLLNPYTQARKDALLSWRNLTKPTK